MKKSELLKLREGVYLVTDNICNYTYIMHKINKEGHIAMLHNTMSKNGTIHIYYELIESFDDDFRKNIPIKRMDCSMMIGGITIHQKGSYGILNKLNLVGIYREGFISEDIKKYSLNHKINLSKYDRRNYYKIKGTR